MAKSQIFPACLSYLDKIANTYHLLSNGKFSSFYLRKEIDEINDLVKQMKDSMDKLEQKIKEAQLLKNDCLLAANHWRDEVCTTMNELRNIVDTLESKVDEQYWPMPTYIDLLFGIK